MAGLALILTLIFNLFLFIKALFFKLFVFLLEFSRYRRRPIPYSTRHLFWPKYFWDFSNGWLWAGWSLRRSWICFREPLGCRRYVRIQDSPEPEPIPFESYTASKPRWKLRKECGSSRPLPPPTHQDYFGFEEIHRLGIFWRTSRELSWLTQSIPR